MVAFQKSWALILFVNTNKAVEQGKPLQNCAGDRTNWFFSTHKHPNKTLLTLTLQTLCNKKKTKEAQILLKKTHLVDRTRGSWTQIIFQNMLPTYKADSISVEHLIKLPIIQIYYYAIIHSNIFELLDRLSAVIWWLQATYCVL